MSAAERLLVEAETYGATLRSDGAELVLKYKSRPPAQFIEDLRTHKAEVLSILQRAPEGPGLPQGWLEGVKRLQASKPPQGVSMARWQRFAADCSKFLADWGEAAAKLGWRAHDLFGLSASAPVTRVQMAGLVWLLDGRRVVALTESTATIRVGSGAVQTYRRTERQAEQALAWEITDAQRK